MYTKSLLAVAAATAHASTTYELPSCWSTCFAKYDVESQGCLCSDSLDDIVAHCVSYGCADANQTYTAPQYGGWLSQYCSEEDKPETTEVYTTICPVTEIHTSDYSTKTKVYTTTSTLTSYKQKATPTTIATYVTKTAVSEYPVASVYTKDTETIVESYFKKSTVTVTYETTKTAHLNTWTGTKSIPLTIPTAVSVSKDHASYVVEKSSSAELEHYPQTESVKSEPSVVAYKSKTTYEDSESSATDSTAVPTHKSQQPAEYVPGYAKNETVTKVSSVAASGTGAYQPTKTGLTPYTGGASAVSGSAFAVIMVAGAAMLL